VSGETGHARWPFGKIPRARLASSARAFRFARVSSALIAGCPSKGKTGASRNEGSFIGSMKVLYAMVSPPWRRGVPTPPDTVSPRWGRGVPTPGDVVSPPMWMEIMSLVRTFLRYRALRVR
jgi:hypothetical protein